jgi:hypothetical protein
MHPIADLRAAVASLNHVPDNTPVEPTLAFGAPNALVYDQANNVVRLSVGWGRSTGRPTMGQLRSWLHVMPVAVPPPAIPAASAVAAKATEVLNGVWASARGREPFTPKGVLTFVSALASGYHGVQRNGGSLLWGAWWFAWGALLPGFIPLVAVAQGYSDCKNDCPQ